MDHFLGACPRFAEELWSAVRDLRGSGAHRKKGEAHRLSMAIKDLRLVTSAALRCGAARDDVVAVLDEEMVRSVQEG